MSKSKCPHLWSVKYSDRYNFVAIDELLICARNAAAASVKALRVLKSKGYKPLKVTEVKYEGSIDAF